MRVITYLGFTVLSIFIQFCVMDFIQERVQIDAQIDDNSYDFNKTSSKKGLTDMLNDFNTKPHALYYRTPVRRSVKEIKSLRNVSMMMSGNSSLPVTPTTDVAVTILDILYDENLSTTDSTYTTETFYTSTEFDNITEITFFETKNTSSNDSHATPKYNFSRDCECNLLFRVCDINCCCDNDCRDAERKIFQCVDRRKDTKFNKCLINVFGKNRKYGPNLFDDLFCVVKTNLPDKKPMEKYDKELIHKYYKWQTGHQTASKSYKFRKTLYNQSDPIWLLKNGTVYYLDLATPMINGYCNDRAPIKFLKEEKVRCEVKLKDLEMFHIIRNFEEAMIISATDKTANSSFLNCLTLHCTNWTILICDKQACTRYNKSLHEASCTEDVCINLALKVEYIFYYFDSKIINTTVKLHIQNISNTLPFMSQEITVRFYIANISIDDIIELSGNPGYIDNRPILVSYAQSNYTDHFHNISNGDKYLQFPENNNGLCILSKTSSNVVKFGINKRMKCRFIDKNIPTKNKTAVCKAMQERINNLIGFNRNVVISPLGNPYGIDDEDWIPLQMDTVIEEPLYAEFNEDSTKLYCRNLITRVLFIFTFVTTDIGQNRIVSAKYEWFTKNASFNIEDISTVLTIDINFLSLSKKNAVQYAGGPSLNIHLPKDFFFPFPSNDARPSSIACLKTIVILYRITIHIK